MAETSKEVPQTQLGDLNQPKLSERIDDVKRKFQQNFAKKPSFIVNVPGRVNLIGEHVDYCGYPVFPMAIEQSILVAAAPSDHNELHVTNLSDKYKSFKCAIETFEIEVPTKGIPPDWYNYFLCGVRGILENLPKDTPKCGMLVTISGNIPPASGLSSSSALVSAATLTTSFVHKFTLDKEILSNISADCERYIGTQGGGMDQAIAFLAIEGCAQFIEWNPLKATPIALPNNTYFVIANCLSRANKAATSDFNQRVIECRLGCRIIAKHLNQNWRKCDRFAVLQKLLHCSLDELEQFTDQILNKEIYNRDDIIEELDVTENDLDNEFLTPNTRHIEKFKLRQRALHVIQESIRVNEFRKAAVESKSFKDLAKLMRESHRSLQEKYECSHPNLDRLIEISDGFGVAARLTGAGWGGCIVAICDSLEKSSRYIQELKDKYYNEILNADVESAVFVTSPQKGAEVLLIN